MSWLSDTYDNIVNKLNAPFDVMGGIFNTVSKVDDITNPVKVTPQDNKEPNYILPLGLAVLLIILITYGNKWKI